jgi:hypothetical protein
VIYGQPFWDITLIDHVRYTVRYGDISVDRHPPITILHDPCPDNATVWFSFQPSLERSVDVRYRLLLHECDVFSRYHGATIINFFDLGLALTSPKLKTPQYQIHARNFDTPSSMHRSLNSPSATSR